MLGHGGDVLLAYQHLSAIDGDGAADDIEHGGFAGAVGADDADELPVWNGQREIPEQAGLVHRAALIVFGDILKLKHDVSPSFDVLPRR